MAGNRAVAGFVVAVLDEWGIALSSVAFIHAMMARVGHDAKGKF
jgi:hypothetical protein